MRLPAKLLKPAFALFLAFIFAGCAHYRLGPGSEPKFSRLYIAPVASEALAPQARELVSTQLREAFAHDGRVTLASSPEEADAVLNVTLSNYERHGTVAQTNDTGLARRFDVVLQARVSLTDTRTKQALLSGREIKATRGVFTDSGQQTAEYQTLPILAEKLASETVHAVLDTW